MTDTPDENVDAVEYMLAESVNDECPTCGAYMLNPALHANWHADILREAQSYVDPPRY